MLGMATSAVCQAGLGTSRFLCFSCGLKYETDLSWLYRSQSESLCQLTCYLTEAKGKDIVGRLFGGGSEGALNMEHFTAAQAAGMGNVGFGLEDSNTPIDESHVADDFESFMSTHLGFEPEENFGAQVSSCTSMLCFAPYVAAHTVAADSLPPDTIESLPLSAYCLVLLLSQRQQHMMCRYVRDTGTLFLCRSTH